ncbi:MAG: peptidyl-prolyl cis-trans isomerase [Pirellulales bacterium]
MARLFYTILFGITASLAAILWLKHGVPSRWLHIFAAPEAQAQSYPVAEAGRPRPKADRYGEPRQRMAASLEAGTSSELPGERTSEAAGTSLDTTRVLATVGKEVILAGDVLGKVNEALATHAGKMQPEQLKRIEPDHWEAARQQLTVQAVAESIDVKMLVEDARSRIPPENMEKILKEIEEDLFEKNQLPRLMAHWQVPSRGELDARLRELGGSVEREKRAYVESVLADQWLGEQVKGVEEITHGQMLEYYQQHRADFEYPAQARWEQLMVRFSNYPSKRAAWEALSQMGNQVWHGAPLADVARARSDGPTAADGGRHGWTTRGSLVSTVIDDALFNLPLGALSEILSDDRGFHIIRVIERKDAGCVTFAEAQVEIREKISSERSRQKRRQYIARLRKNTPVWTVYDAGRGDSTASAQSPRR